jgi:Domain of unknown function (DUF4437)
MITPIKRSLFAAATILGAMLAGASYDLARAAPVRALAAMASDPALKWGPCPPVFPAGCEIAVLHGDPSKPNADVFLRVPASYEIPAHWHTSAERMVLVTGELKVTYKGQAASSLAVGNYAYGPAKLAHKAKCLGAQACTLFIAFETPVDAHLFKGKLD